MSPLKEQCYIKVCLTLISIFIISAYIPTTLWTEKLRVTVFWILLQYYSVLYIITGTQIVQSSLRLCMTLSLLFLFWSLLAYKFFLTGSCTWFTIIVDMDTIQSGFRIVPCTIVYLVIIVYLSSRWRRNELPTSFSKQIRWRLRQVWSAALCATADRFHCVPLVKNRWSSRWWCQL